MMPILIKFTCLNWQPNKANMKLRFVVKITWCRNSKSAYFEFLEYLIYVRYVKFYLDIIDPSQAVNVPIYSELEYQQHLHDENWSRPETEYLLELCRRFDLRFIVIHDRWDRQRFPNRSVEDLKERYYVICNTLAKVRGSLLIIFVNVTK